MLSMKTKYGIKALTYICSHAEDGPIPISKIAEEENISHKFLESILLTLRKGGILLSKKGKGGGYYLSKSPKEIPMVDIVRLLNGPVALLPCVSLNYYETCDDCPSEEECATHLLMLEIRDSTLNILKNKSLADLTKESRKTTL